MSIVPEQAVFGPSRTLNSDLAAVGWVMLAGLAGFYAIFFTFLYRRARVVSHRIAEPLRQIERMAHRIAVGDYEQASPEFGVSEFRHTVGELQRMGRLLGDSNRARENARGAAHRAQRGAVDDPQPVAGRPRVVRRRGTGDGDQSGLPRA